MEVIENLFNWAQEHITWAGNSKTNKSDRRGYIPKVIVNHITEGSASSCIMWFTSEVNKNSSAHFLVTRKGEIYQFVSIEENAWANGLSLTDIPKAPSPVVKSTGVNPNWYSVSIEHEGIFNETHGELTGEQLKATIMLHKYIIAYVKNKYGYDIPINKDYIIGHFMIDPVRKPNCPGKLFPFSRIIQELGGDKVNLPFDDIDNHWAKEAILKAVELKLIQGDGTRLFKPDKQVTKAELVQVVLNLYNLLKS